MNEIHRVVEAFADGEPVDPAKLTQALSEAAGREHLIDLLALRSLVGGQASETENRCRASVFSPGRENRRPASVFFAAAALVAIGVLTGFIAGQRTVGGTRPAAPSVTVVNAPPQVTPLSAPVPTRVIHLQNGVDWNERGGGN